MIQKEKPRKSPVSDTRAGGASLTHDKEASSNIDPNIEVYSKNRNSVSDLQTSKSNTMVISESSTSPSSSPFPTVSDLNVNPKSTDLGVSGLGSYPPALDAFLKSSDQKSASKQAISDRRLETELTHSDASGTDRSQFHNNNQICCIYTSQ
jgi:hypothetical protein